MSIWSRFADTFRNEAKKYKKPFLSPSQVDVRYDATPIAAGTSYCRLWLVEMHLARGVDWFQNRYPAVYAATRYDYGGKQVTVPYVAGLEAFKELSQSHLDRVISYNRPLTPLFPFNRGDVEIQAGLVSMKTSDPIGKFIGVMGRLSSLLPVPELSSVIKIAEPIYNSLEDLFDAGESRFELGYQQTFSAAGGGGGNDLKPGYFAAVLAPSDTFNDSSLCVVQDSLHLRADGPTSTPQPLSGYNYMLFRFEKRNEQDWGSLTSIKELVGRAQDAIGQGQSQVANQLLTSIRVAVFQSPDVARADRAGMYARIHEELRELGLQSPNTRRAARSLHAIMQRPLPALDAQTISTVSALETFFQADA